MLGKNENGQQPWLPAVLGLLTQRLQRLTVSATAAMETATTTSAMEAATAAAVEDSATTVEATAAWDTRSPAHAHTLTRRRSHDHLQIRDPPRIPARRRTHDRSRDRS